MKYLERNPVTAVFFFGLCVCVSLGANNIKSQWSAVASLQQKVQQNNQQQWNLTLSQQQADEQAKIAEARYTKGCRLVVSKRRPDQFTTLTEGQPVFDRTRNTPLPVGTVVCDAYGNTARIVDLDGEQRGLGVSRQSPQVGKPAHGAGSPSRATANPKGDPVVGEIAFTGNQEVIDRVTKKTLAKYSSPNL